MENKPPIKWQALEYEHNKKSPDWFWALWIISLGVIIVSILFHSFLFAILVFVASFTVSIQATKDPSIIDCELDSGGITMYGRKYVFGELESYWIEEEDFPRIILKSKKHFMPYITIPLGNADISRVDGFLMDYLDKIEHHEPLPYKLMRYF